MYWAGISPPLKKGVDERKRGGGIFGGQHFEEGHMQQDQMRDAYLKNQNLQVLRFDNLQVLQSIDNVLEVIFNELQNI
jgi:very-short-patch-repair endonuclease